MRGKTRDWGLNARKDKQFHFLQIRGLKFESRLRDMGLAAGFIFSA